MKTDLTVTISTSEDAKTFLTNLYNNGEDYHPEDSAIDVVKTGTSEASFTEEEAKRLDVLMTQVYVVADFCPCEFLNDLINLKTSKVITGNCDVCAQPYTAETSFNCTIGSFPKTICGSCHTFFKQ